MTPPRSSGPAGPAPAGPALFRLWFPKPRRAARRLSTLGGLALLLALGAPAGAQVGRFGVVRLDVYLNPPRAPADG